MDKSFFGHTMIKVYLTAMLVFRGVFSSMRFMLVGQLRKQESFTMEILSQRCRHLHILQIQIHFHLHARESCHEQAMTSTRYSTQLGIFSLLVPYSEILLLGRVASNGNKKHQRFKIGCRQHTCNIFLYHLDIIRFLK